MSENDTTELKEKATEADSTPSKPKSRRSRPADVTVRNRTPRAITLFDTDGNGVHIGPRGSVTVKPSEVSDEMRRRAARNDITLS